MPCLYSISHCTIIPVALDHYSSRLIHTRSVFFSVINARLPRFLSRPISLLFHSHQCLPRPFLFVAADAPIIQAQSSGSFVVAWVFILIIWETCFGGTTCVESFQILMKYWILKIKYVLNSTIKLHRLRQLHLPILHLVWNIIQFRKAILMSVRF